MNRRLLPFTVLSVLTLAACGASDTVDRIDAGAVESARLTAEAVVAQVSALASLQQGMDSSFDARTESVWALTATDLDPSVRILDGTGAPVADTADLHDRYTVVQTFAAFECSAPIAATGPGSFTVGDVSCAKKQTL